jgi:hypothetical protein
MVGTGRLVGPGGIVDELSGILLRETGGARRGWMSRAVIHDVEMDS